MDQYNNQLNQIYKILIKKDEDDRKSRKLQKSRSDIEAIKYRMDFDEYYKKYSDEIVNSILHEVGTFPNPISERSDTYYKVGMQNIYERLDPILIIPHAIIKVIDFKTQSGGKSTDIGKVCNLYALCDLLALGEALKFDIHLECARALQHLIQFFNTNNISDVFFSKRGFETCAFLYWLIYDNDKKILDLNMLIQLSDATKGSFTDFRSYMVGFWLLKNTNPFKTIEYSSIIQSIHKWSS